MNCCLEKLQPDIRLVFEESSNTLATIAEFARTSTIKEPRETEADVLTDVRKESQTKEVRFVDGKWRDSVTMETISKEGLTLKTADGQHIEIPGHLDTPTTDTDVATVTRMDSYGSSTCRCHKCSKEVTEWDGYAKQHKLTVTTAAVRHWVMKGEMPAKQRTNKPSGKRETHTYSGPNISNAILSGATLEHKKITLSDGTTRGRWWLEWDVWLPACGTCKEIALARICKLSNKKKRED